MRIALRVLLAGAALLSQGVAADETRVVRDVAELRAALAGVTAGSTVRLLASDYAIDQPIVVPDGVTLEGVGRMEIRDGSAAGFGTVPASVLRAAAAFDGDVVTLGDGSALRSLAIVDQVPERGAPMRAGNVVSVVSRAERDRLSARIDDCEIVTGAASGVTPRGPIGHAIVVLTRSPTLGQQGSPHLGARVNLHVSRSVIRAQGLALFAVNFASAGRIDIALSGNLVSGAVVATGGVSRPARVTDARTELHSTGNRYRLSPGGDDDFGWMVFGGSSPHLNAPEIPGPERNTLVVTSTGDRIEGFRIGILAAGARRRIEASGPLSDNRADLELRDLTIAVPDASATGVALHGAVSGTGLAAGPAFPAGEHNELHLQMQSVRYEGTPGQNRYSANFSGDPVDPAAATNRLVVDGTADQFATENPGFAAPPPGDFAAPAPTH